MTLRDWKFMGLSFLIGAAILVFALFMINYVIAPLSLVNMGG